MQSLNPSLPLAQCLLGTDLSPSWVICVFHLTIPWCHVHVDNMPQQYQQHAVAESWAGASVPTPMGPCSVAATQTALGPPRHPRTWERVRGKQVHFPLRKISGLSPGNEKHRLLSFGWGLLIHFCSVSVSRCNLQLSVFYPLPNVHSEADGT